MSGPASEKQLRADIVAACHKLEAMGLNRGASGNISVRYGDAMLITPSAIPYDALTPDMIAVMDLGDETGAWQGPKAPSSEWRFHRDILRARPDMGSVVHTHAPYCTILADARRPIPAIHYMIAAFGTVEIPVAGYARYGTQELSQQIIKALGPVQGGSKGCLMANHGMIVGEADLTRALWLAGELESLAHQYYHLLAIGGGHGLSAAESEDTARGFESYGVQSKGDGAS